MEPEAAILTASEGAMAETGLKKLCLISHAPRGLISGLDHSPIIRETLRGLLELEVGPAERNLTVKSDQLSTVIALYEI
ncbi:Hypothetical protein NTJ_09211 [Nesidiocoris tenuis]|uniref:Uncharacterized protein n=1 Tax=Nesidiocoris tenuis TaxID=355587 RepID=A0ABN7AW30_9HEMI|nr:Hypothetical protein NTJ_09211 [Nesidiocoris tenuis]